MLKVHLKISGCFRSFEGAIAHCRIRSFMMTCDKHGVNKFQALRDLFEGKYPDFADERKESLENEPLAELGV
jgi:transposase